MRERDKPAFPQKNGIVGIGGHKGLTKLEYTVIKMAASEPMINLDVAALKAVTLWDKIEGVKSEI